MTTRAVSTRQISILGARTNLGLGTYEDTGLPRHANEAVDVYRRLGVIDRLGARGLGDVPAPAYRDLEWPPGKIRNELEIVEYSRLLAARVAAAVESGDFLLLLGGDCSVLLGALLGLGRYERVGLAYIDGHADINHLAVSTTGGAAGMDLALALGRGTSPLAHLRQPAGAPLVRGADVAVLGRRYGAESNWEPGEVLREEGILDLKYEAVRKDPAAAARQALERIARPELPGFWIHLDADVIDSKRMWAVDSPDPGGLSLEELAELLSPLARHPKAIGLQVTIYDPGLDPTSECGERIVNVLERALA
ncbi:MAG TPA: arginase family protein [Thermoanaerobaculia bacterium]